MEVQWTSEREMELRLACRVTNESATPTLLLGKISAKSPL
jgi:hypothetical protein